MLCPSLYRLNWNSEPFGEMKNVIYVLYEPHLKLILDVYYQISQ